MDLKIKLENMLKQEGLWVVGYREESDIIFWRMINENFIIFTIVYNHSQYLMLMQISLMSKHHQR